MEFLPKYIRQVVEKLQGQVVTAEEWNNLFNLLIEQGDNNTEGIVTVINNLSENYPTTQLVQDLITQYIKKIGAADMSTEVYDTDKDGIVDKAAVANTVNDGAITSEKIANNAITGDKIVDGAITENKLEQKIIDVLQHLLDTVGVLTILNGIDEELEGSRDMYTFGFDEITDTKYRINSSTSEEYICGPNYYSDPTRIQISKVHTDMSGYSTIDPLVPNLILNQEYLIRDVRNSQNTHATKLTEYHPEEYSLGKITKLANNYYTSSTSWYYPKIRAKYNNTYLLTYYASSGGISMTPFVCTLLTVEDDYSITEKVLFRTYSKEENLNVYWDIRHPEKAYMITQETEDTSATYDPINVNYREIDLKNKTHTVTTLHHHDANRYISYAWDGIISPTGIFYFYTRYGNSDNYNYLVTIYKFTTQLIKIEGTSSNGALNCSSMVEYAPNKFKAFFSQNMGSSKYNYHIVTYKDNVANVTTSNDAYTLAQGANVWNLWGTDILTTIGTTMNKVTYNSDADTFAYSGKYKNHANAYVQSTTYAEKEPTVNINTVIPRSDYTVSGKLIMRHDSYYKTDATSLSAVRTYFANLDATQSILYTPTYRPEGATSNTSLTYRDIHIDVGGNLVFIFTTSGSSNPLPFYVEVAKFIPDSYTVDKPLPDWFVESITSETHFVFERLEPLFEIPANTFKVNYFTIENNTSTFTNLNMILQLDRKIKDDEYVEVYYSPSNNEEFVKLEQLSSSTQTTLYYEIATAGTPINTIKVITKTTSDPLIIKKVLGGADNEI